MKSIFVVPLTKEGQLTLPDLTYTVNDKIPDGTGYSLLEEPKPGMTSIKVMIDTSAGIMTELKKTKDIKHVEDLAEPKPESIDPKVIKSVYEVLDTFKAERIYPEMKAAMDSKLGVSTKPNGGTN